ncbi:hypothetical protein CORC01_13236 [Colletotrichum orchidophilum]|uniref:C2H2-type domain-containing protein n=1 Tax=Colletotrichum orchidophilum TaxID=1209926 RepID=A0A1G4AQL1_9PEZI|nr:uncharacterized protein CORC01_13236 [Colletotrichum orchidophilum]OHE91464.1 hypothetical protein CORC01_13236 [Colletotrichum orchidophilum]
MDSLRNKRAVDPKYLLRLFLNAAVGEIPLTGASLVARLTKDTIAVFQYINRSIVDGAKAGLESQPYSVSLGRSLDRLRLWSDGYRISSGGFDDIFEQSSRLRRATLKILSSIGLTLTERLIVSGLWGKKPLSDSFEDEVEQLRQLIQEVEDYQPKNESSAGSSEYDDDDINQITADLETDTSGLMDLDVLFSDPIFDMDHKSQGILPSLHTWAPHEPSKQITVDLESGANYLMDLNVSFSDSIFDMEHESQRFLLSLGTWPSVDPKIQITADLETDTSGLRDLDVSFSDPIFDMDHESQHILPSLYTWAPHVPFKQIIKTRFPKGNEDLITSLAKANYERFLRGQEQRNIQMVAPGDSDPNEALLPAQIKDSDAASSKFLDSGLGSSVPSSYAETIVSYHGGEGTPVRLPPLPKGAAQGKAFLCVACGKLTVAIDMASWKRHLFKDLRPWQCLESSCTHRDVFSSHQDWVSHLALDHELDPQWKGAECPLCRDDTGQGKTAIVKHLGGHLEEISLAALPFQRYFDDETEYSDGNQQDEAAGSPGADMSPGPLYKNGLEFLTEVYHGKPRLYQALVEEIMKYNRKEYVNIQIINCNYLCACLIDDFTEFLI